MVLIISGLINGKNIMSSEKGCKWSVFFKEQRWKSLIDKFMVEELFELWVKCMKIYDLIDQILETDPTPCLLHGDMNRSNYGIIESNGVKKVYWFDAQCFYGDPLYDLQSFIQWFDPLDKDNKDNKDPEIQIKIAKKYDPEINTEFTSIYHVCIFLNH